MHRDHDVPRPRSGAEAPFEPGDWIDGTYRVARVLGEGSMGVVLLARDAGLERDVAIKVIRPGCLSMPGFRDGFLAEARAMARVHHENVVAIHAFGMLGHAPYFVMEHVPGADLDTWLSVYGLPTIDIALGILTQVARGLSAIHDAGTIHRDVKPSNVLIGSGFRVALTDFGLAHIAADGSGKIAFPNAGAPDYIAPELQLDASPVVTAAADVYSLGVLAFLLLTGELPYAPAPSGVARFQRPARRCTDARPSLPAAFDPIVAAALELRPEERTSSARQLMTELNAVRHSTRASPRDPSPRVVVAEDDHLLRALVVSMVRSAVPGARIEQAIDGAAAIAALQCEPADLVILDLQMPGHNGFEVTAVLRASEQGRHTPVLIMTATGGAADWRVLAAMGANAFLVKPFQPEEMVAAVSRLLQAAEG